MERLIFDGPNSVSVKLDDWNSASSRKNLFFLGNNLEMLASLGDESVNLVITSPPYNIGKSYEEKIDFEKYLDFQKQVISECVRVLKPGGSICWQVGFSISDGELLPLDIVFYPIFKSHNLVLRNRIIWSFGHGLHARSKFSGRHETILWFSKGKDLPHFDLDAVRVPQLYPEKKHYKGPKKGQLSSNPLGKNPGDVWDIPNVKAHHVEKTTHDCQFPIALVQRLIRALCPPGGLVLDPFAGVATTGCAAEIEGRPYVLAEKDPGFHKVGLDRLSKARNGQLNFRDLSQSKKLPKVRTAIKPLFDKEVGPA